MPRVYTSCSDPIDFCANHFPPEHVAMKRYGNILRTGEGPDGRGNCFGYNCEHPDYEDTDYRCHICRKKLRASDD